METKFKFNSQVCTDKNQSERLLALGLKKETADMCSVIDFVSDNGKTIEEVDTIFTFTPDDWEGFGRPVTPRWSLHRLIEMCDVYIKIYRLRVMLSNYEVFNKKETTYDNLIDCIEWLIKEGYFNKEYLV